MYTYLHMHQEMEHTLTHTHTHTQKPKPDLQCGWLMEDPGGCRNPIPWRGHALIWLWFYGRHKPDGPQLVLLGQTVCVSAKSHLV